MPLRTYQTEVSQRIPGGRSWGNLEKPTSPTFSDFLLKGPFITGKRYQILISVLKFQIPPCSIHQPKKTTWMFSLLVLGQRASC